MCFTQEYGSFYFQIPYFDVNVIGIMKKKMIQCLKDQCKNKLPKNQ